MKNLDVFPAFEATRGSHANISQSARVVSQSTSTRIRGGVGQAGIQAESMGLEAALHRDLEEIKRQIAALENVLKPFEINRISTKT